MGFKKDWGTWINKLTYQLSQIGLVKSTRDAQKSLNVDWNFSKAAIRDQLTTAPVIYAVSQTLFRRADHWPEHLQVLGQRARKIEGLTPLPEDLITFLDGVEKPLFISFGSMKSNTIEATSRLILQTLTALEIPAVINTSSGGIVAVDDYASSPQFYFTNEVAYELIFPKVYAVIHHGGAGTTHQGLRHGKPTLIIPHAMDQYSWNQLVYDRKARPLGPSIKDIDQENFRRALKDLYNNPIYKQNAEKLGSQMQAGNLDDKLYAFMMRYGGSGA
ncbi:MAG: nucleotide disphospho-sugar-binding domain-containing protein [Nonlabens sp.]